MLRVSGSHLSLCNGLLTRREALRVGGALGLTLAGAFRRAEARAPIALSRNFGKAKSCILLYLYGSPSQLETFDTKPDAPDGVRGELKSIRSNVSGLDVGELLPNMAKVMDKVTVLRSLTHPYPIHGAAFALTGVPSIDVAMVSPRDSKHWPFIGSVVDYVDRHSGRGRARIPSNIALPFPFSSQRTGEVHRAGPYAAYLGGAYNPLWTSFVGTATVRTVKTLAPNTLDVAEPYMGIAADCRFRIGAADAGASIQLDRLDGRRSLLEQLDARRRELGKTEAGQNLDRQRGRALELVTSQAVREALDPRREPMRVRESYGHTLFGQSCLTARRLVEAGTRFVSVFWDEFGLAGSAWDTHWEHYPRMKNELCPGFDRGLAGLLTDLDARGLLDETLVLCLSEHGRTPQLNRAKGGGRDHWSRAYSALLAGGGTARGKAVGRTDKIAGDVTERPISPKDVLATAYHLLGIDPETTLEDRTARPMPLVQGAEVIAEALA